MSTLPLAKNFLSSKPKKAILKSKPYKASPLCVLCEFVMTELKTLLSENATQVIINFVLNKNKNIDWLVLIIFNEAFSVVPTCANFFIGVIKWDINLPTQF